MKRLFLFCSCFLIFLSTGCGSKSSNNSEKINTSKMLECNSSSNIGSSSSSQQNFKIYFNKGKVERLLVDIAVSLNEPDDVTRNNLEQEVSNAFDKYKNRDGITYSSNVSERGFNVDLDINFNNLSDEDRQSISLINSEKSYDEIKIEFETNGFICN